MSKMTSVPKNDVQWRNGLQTAAMATASSLFIAGGMEMALGLGWNFNTFFPTTKHFQFCFFIGVIVGVIVAAPLIPYLQKRIFLLISSLLVLTSGIIYVSLPKEYEPIIAARYISGIGIGLAMITFIVHGSEVSASSCRGTVLSLEEFFFTLGIAIQIIYSSIDVNFITNRLHGIFMIIFGSIALGLLYLVIESPIFYIRKCDNETALECLRLLERPQIVTIQTKVKLEELKNYVKEEKNQSLPENFRKSILPFLKVLLYRSVVGFTFSYPLNFTIIIGSVVSLEFEYRFPLTIFILLRIFGGLLTVWLSDVMGRKLLPLLALLCIAGLNICAGIQFRNDIIEHIDSQEMSIVLVLIIISQFFAGVFIPYSSICLGEAFPLILKPYMIALCICVQQVIDIVILASFDPLERRLYVYFITIGCIMFVSFLYFCVALPETKKTTLSEAQKRFRNCFYLKMF